MKKHFIGMLLLSLMIVVLAAGCGADDSASSASTEPAKEKSTAEQAITECVSHFGEAGVSASDLYVTDENSWFGLKATPWLKREQIISGAKLQKVENLKIENVKDEGKYVKADLTYDLGTQHFEKQPTLFVRGDDGKLRVAYDRVVKVTEYKAVPSIQMPGVKISCKIGETLDCNGYILALTFRNEGKRGYSFGWVEPAYYDLVTASGTLHPTTLSLNGTVVIDYKPVHNLKLAPHGNDCWIYIPYSGKPDGLKTIDIDGFYPLTGGGLPASQTPSHLTLTLTKK